MDEIIKLVKLQKMWTTSAFDELIMSKAKAAMSDMAIVGIPEMSDPLYREAVVTYCVMNLGVINPQEYDRLKRAYDEMRGQMQTAVTAKRYNGQEVL